MMRLTYAVSLLLVLPQLSMPAAGQTTPGPAWGVSVEGLRLSMALVEGAKREPSVEVTFENAGPQDALLNLGLMVGNGRTMVPHAVRLVVRGATFGTCELEYADRRVTHVGGALTTCPSAFRGAGATRSDCRCGTSGAEPANSPGCNGLRAPNAPSPARMPRVGLALLDNGTRNPRCQMDRLWWIRAQCRVRFILR